MNSLVNKVSKFYLIYIFAGFLLISILPSIVGNELNSLSIVYRASVLLFSIFIITNKILTGNFLLSFKPYYSFFLFFGLYSIRLLYDIFFMNVYILPEKSYSEYLLYVFGIVLIPTLGIIFIDISKINLAQVLKWIYIIIFITLLIAMLSRSNDLSGRTKGDLEIGILLYGQFGTTLGILSIYYLLESRFTMTSLLFLIGLIVGFVTIFISASRSPFVALVLASGIYLFSRKSSTSTSLTILAAGVVLYIYFIDLLQLMSTFFDSPFLTRLEYALVEGESGGRDELIGSGMTEFLNSPFFGNSFLIQSGARMGSYPHNLIVESFMATGFFGGLVFLYFLFTCAQLSRKTFKTNSCISWVPLIFLQFFIFGMFSGNLFSSNLFWYSSILLIKSSFPRTLIQLPT